MYYLFIHFGPMAKQLGLNKTIVLCSFTNSHIVYFRSLKNSNIRDCVHIVPNLIENLLIPEKQPPKIGGSG